MTAMAGTVSWVTSGTVALDFTGTFGFDEPYTLDIALDDTVAATSTTATSATYTFGAGQGSATFTGLTSGEVISAATPFTVTLFERGFSVSGLGFDYVSGDFAQFGTTFDLSSLTAFASDVVAGPFETAPGSLTTDTFNLFLDTTSASAPSAVPLPGGLGLAAMGLGALGLARRRAA